MIAPVPAEIDARLAELFGSRLTTEARIASTVNAIHSYAEERPARGQSYRLTLDEAIASGPRNAYDARQFEYHVERLSTLRPELAELTAGIDELDSIFRSVGGWSRFFLVPGGHVHSAMDCSTCNNGKTATKFGWLPTLSGKTEADAVAEHGALLCTVCYPSAPVEWTNHYDELAAAKKSSSCSGSGTYNYPNETARLGYYTGNYGVCSDCGQRVTVTSTGKLRTHKPTK